MIHTKRLSILAILTCIVLFLCSCRGSSNLLGNWICNEVRNGYPDQMTLYKDGTGIIDGWTCNWTADNGTITFIASVVTGSQRVSYNYRMSDSKLYLDGFEYIKK